ncbi:MAG: nitroreductase family deazaflavin-dependent oxidoreductase [Pseudomonadales bacterium]|nr:nitroreductase family deazaflavin-dependent oxidoreductase [Pseudomonadales bacterium]
MAEVPAGLPKWIADHVELYLTDPEKAHLWDASLGGGKGKIPTLLLEMTGRKSGEKRMLPLIYKKVGDAFVIIASKGGAPAHPSWYLNLKANPDCEIRVGKDRFKVRARDAEGAEREKLWDELVDVYAPYTQYQERTQRQIPVVVLDPV